MEIATPARSSPFPKLTFDHQLIIAKHLVSTNDEKRKTPNHLNGDESSTCDLMDGNYENGAKTRLNETKIIGGVIQNGVDKATVGVKPITVQQRQDNMPTKMNENHLNGAALMMKMNGDDLCNNNNNTNRDNTSSNNCNIKLSYDAYKSLDGNNTSVTVHDGNELSHEVIDDCNSKISSNTNSNYNDKCENESKSNEVNSEGFVSSSGTTNSVISVCKETTTFKVPESTLNNNFSSTTPSPSVPYRKQSVFVAPAGLNWIIHKSRNNHLQQQQPQQHPISTKHNLDSSGVVPSSSTSTTFSTFYTSPIEGNGETSSNKSSSLNGSHNNNDSASNSCISNFTSTRKNSTGLQPKANAQEIEQHISKIISENAAIVDTLDPLWPKRYLSRHSVSSVPSGSMSYPVTLSTGTTTSNTTHGSNSNLHSRRFSEMSVDPNHVSGSKLQSALLGRIFTTNSLTSGSTVVTPSNVPHAHQHPSSLTLPVHPGPAKKFSEPIYPSVIISMKQQQHQQSPIIMNKPSNGSSGTGVIGIQSSHAHETGLESSLVRNLLTSSKSSPTVRVIPVPVSSSSSSQISGVTGLPIVGLTLDSGVTSRKSSSTCNPNIVDANFNVNPENPEGSIIKDLLLKARDSGEPNERKISRPTMIPPIQEELSMLVYVCTLCKIAFRNKETLEAHQLHYCKANETQSTNELSLNQLQLLNDHVQRKMSVMESNFLQQQLTKPVQSSCSNLKPSNVFSQPQHVSIKHTYQSSLNQSQQQQQQPIVGNILKQQLLAPSAGPPLKKRKTSEPLFTKSYLRHHQSNYNLQYPLTGDSNSHFTRKTSIVQGLPSKLPYIASNSNKLNNKEGLIESYCLNSGLSPSIISDNNSSNSSHHVISVLNEPITFPSNSIVTHSAVFPSSSSNPHNFVNQSSLDRLSTNQSTKPFDILPDYYPHLKYPETKVTLSGPIVFPVLRKILLENKENIEFQASPEALHSSDSSLSSSNSSTLVTATASSASTINPSGHAVNDTINTSCLVYKQIPSIPEFGEDQIKDKQMDDKMKGNIKIEEDENCQEMESLTDKTDHENGEKTESETLKPMNELLSKNSKFDTKMNGSINSRPTSLTIRKRSSLNVFNQLIGSTLVSPDTPRPKRKCMQLYMKGQTYTYLGLKMSTRSTYCCIYRPQPMYVPQEAQSKLSMYSNWQILSPHDDIFKLISPSELFHAYDTRQWCFEANGVKVTFAPSSESKKSLNDSCILTPSSYWTIKKQSEEKALIKREIIELKRKGIEDLTDLMDKSVINSRKTSEDRLSTMSGFDSDSNDPNQPKRVKIFEGGFKSNEDYTYVRGRGRGKYVCEECGIRCKKPSMLKKHIRTHTDLRPYSCRHCAFAFKTKGNLTKHMKSKAHHKKCVELGIIPVPITIDDSQIDCDALAKQEALERSYSGEHLASDDDENDPDDEDGCEEEEDDGSDDEGVPIPIITSSGVITNHHKMDIDGRPEERKEREHRKSIIVANEIDEQEVARSLLVLSGSGEWSIANNPSAVAVATITTASGVTVASNCLEADFSDNHRTASSPSKQHMDVVTDLRKISQSTPSKLSLNNSLADERCSTAVNGANYINLSNWPPNGNSFSRQRSFSFNDGLMRRNVSMANNLDNLRRVDKPTPLSSNHFCLTNEPINSQANNTNPIIESISTDDSNDSEVEDHFQRRYSMSVIQDRRNESLYLNSDGPIDLSKRQEDNDNQIAGPSSRYDQILPGRRNTLSTPSTVPHHLTRAELAASFNGSSLGMLTREDGKSVCRKCNKTFHDLSKLRLHVNVHYLERPFRCDPCGVSFRTKGHLQKHEKSASHSDKIKINLTFGAATTENPRPFKCDDCVIAFRIHGHLAKHLRSKNHIMKLECAGKLPCGMYADMERFGINLNVIETADCENSLVSLQKLAEKMYSKNGEVNLAWLRQSSLGINSNLSLASNNLNHDGNIVTCTSTSTIATSNTTVNHNSFENNCEMNVDNNANDCNNNTSSDIVNNSININNHDVNNNHSKNCNYSLVNTSSSSPSPPSPPSTLSPPVSSPYYSTCSTTSAIPSVTTTTFTTTPISVSTTSSTTNITSIRSNTCHFCKQVFKSAKFLQVHLYCDHQQQRSSSPNLVTDPQHQPQTQS
uniref:Uncharacterized protein n=1 Tax=Tetranychus urticae TaxID=32264 RepID=T1K2N6_TETUR